MQPHDGIALVPADLRRAPEVAARLCAEDLTELRVLGMDPQRALTDSIANSHTAWFLKLRGEIGAVFGVVKLEGGGRFWLLTTPAVRRWPKLFLRAAKNIVPALLGEYKSLWNELGIHTEHKQALRLAEHMGFKLMEQREVRPGVFFVPFTIAAGGADVHRS